MNFNSPSSPATPGSSQNSQPSIISISSTSPQSSSGLEGEGGTPQQAQVIVSQVQTPEGDGSDERKTGACGGSKTPHNVQVNGGEKEDEAEVKIVADKGIQGPGTMSLSRGQRLDRKLSEGSELNPEEQRMLKTRENERKRRQTQKESPDRLRELLGLHDGNCRKVGEGVVMFKSVEFIESLLTQLKQRETEVAALRTEVRRLREFPQVEMVTCLMRNGIHHQTLYDGVMKSVVPTLDHANAKKISNLAPDFQCLPEPYKDKICMEIRIRCADKYAENVNPNSGFVPIEAYAQRGQRQMFLPQSNQIRVTVGASGARGMGLGRFVPPFKPSQVIEDEGEEMAGDQDVQLQQEVNGPRLDSIKPNLNTVKQEIDEHEMDLEGNKHEPELPKLPLPGFKFNILKDKPGNNDDTFGGGACGVICENSPGNRVQMGSRSALERAWDQGRDDAERAERFVSDVEKEVRMLTVEDFAYHERVFREHPLFRFDFIWRGMDEEEFKRRVEEIVDECWKETLVAAEEFKKKADQDYKRFKMEEEKKMMECGNGRRSNGEGERKEKKGGRGERGGTKK